MAPSEYIETNKSFIATFSIAVLLIASLFFHHINQILEAEADKQAQHQEAQQKRADAFITRYSKKLPQLITEGLTMESIHTGDKSLNFELQLATEIPSEQAEALRTKLKGVAIQLYCQSKQLRAAKSLSWPSHFQFLSPSRNELASVMLTKEHCSKRG